MDKPRRSNVVFLGAEYFDWRKHPQIASALDMLFSNIIFPKFVWMSGAQFYIDDEVDIGHSVKLEIRIASYEEIKPGEYRDSTDFLTNYMNVSGTIVQNIRDEVFPTVNPAEIIAAGLSPDQFVIRCSVISMTPNVGVYEQLAPERHLSGPTFGKEVFIKLTVIIEDISEFEPGGRLQLETKYNFLCRDTTITATQELRDWVLEIGHSPFVVNNMNKATLCRIVRDFYEF